MAKVVDDRTDEQRVTHHLLVYGTDPGMSRWGRQSGICQRSIAAWACTPDDLWKVDRWVRDRGDIRRVRHGVTKIRGRRGDHIHIYVVTDEHPAIRKETANAND